MKYSSIFLLLSPIALVSAIPRANFCTLKDELEQCSTYLLGVEGPIPETEAYHGRAIGKLLAEYVKKRDYPPNLGRAFHANQHGCPTGYLKVRDDIPKEFAVGPFKRGNRYRITSSFATLGAVPISDKRVFEKSLAIKIHGVKGKKLQGGYENENSMDLLMNQQPHFAFKDINDFYQFVHFLVYHDDFTGAKFLEKNPDAAPLMATLTSDDKKTGSIFDVTYHSGTPYRWGKNAVKFRAVPQKISGKAPPTEEEGYWKEAKESLAESEFCFDLEVQRQENACTEPIEDATVEWNTDFTKVAEICFPKQSLTENGSNSVQDVECRNSFFLPWLTTKDFRPLGGINRGRMHPYRTVGEDRQAFNGFKNARVNSRDLDNQPVNYEVPYAPTCKNRP